MAQPAISVEHLPGEFRARPGVGDRRHTPISLDELERQHIERTLKHHAGNRTRAAAELGISRATLINKIKRYNDHPPEGAWLRPGEKDAMHLPRMRPRGARLRGLSLHRLRHVHLPDLFVPRRDALCCLPEGGGAGVARHVNAVIATAGIAPMLAAAAVRAEQTSQPILGETGRVMETSGEWLRVRSDVDGYAGWVHRGYLRTGSEADAARWRREATAWSEGARVDSDDIIRPIPLRARLVLDGDVVILPDGGRGRVLDGVIRPALEAARGAARQPAERWALERFGGTAYQWGGLTPCGVDCSGLVQTTFLARGLVVPRDSSEQRALRRAGGSRRGEAGEFPLSSEAKPAAPRSPTSPFWPKGRPRGSTAAVTTRWASRIELLFPEIDYMKVDKARGMNVSVVTTAKTDEEARKLLQFIGMPFRQS